MHRRTATVIALVGAVCVALPAESVHAAEPSITVLAERVDDARAELRTYRAAEVDAREVVRRRAEQAAEASRKLDIAAAVAQRAVREHREATREVAVARRTLGNLAATNYQSNSGMAQFAFLIAATNRTDLRARADLVTVAQQSQEQVLASAQVDLADTANTVEVTAAEESAAQAAHVTADQALATSRRHLEEAAEQRASAQNALDAAESRYASARAAAPTPASAQARLHTAGRLLLPSAARITSPYGMRTHPITGVHKLHTGTDFGASCGSGVRAAAGGTVTSTGYAGAYGNRIVIDHGKSSAGRVETTYNHLEAFDVRAGEMVTGGELIGRVGTTGFSTGCHLHFEVVVDGEFTDPMGWLR